jgi:dihydrofolate reductase
MSEGLKKKISIIVAVAENNAIGKDNKLLWHISEDLKRFKQITSGNTVVMGKNTFYSLPVRPLPKRTNIVITDIPGEIIEGCAMAYSINEAIQLCHDTNENFIIGGASIYRQFLPLADKLYITAVHKPFEADCFFPEIATTEWKLISKEDCNSDTQNDFTYSYLVYERIYA